MIDPEMIHAGDPRHPCPTCGGRDATVHPPCAPVPRIQAYCPPNVLYERRAADGRVLKRIVRGEEVAPGVLQGGPFQWGDPPAVRERRF